MRCEVFAPSMRPLMASMRKWTIISPWLVLSRTSWASGVLAGGVYRRGLLPLLYLRSRGHVFYIRGKAWGLSRGELFPRVGFIVTNMTAGPEGVVRFYNGRGTAEQWIKGGEVRPEPGLGCRAIGSWPTGCVCLCSSWRTTLGTSFAGCVCPKRSSTGRCGACRSS